MFSGEIDLFCKANPGAIKPHESNCAQYYNCSNWQSNFGHHLQECEYPDLFSSLQFMCLPFENVTCEKRQEPTSPCMILFLH